MQSSNFDHICFNTGLLVKVKHIQVFLRVFIQNDLIWPLKHLLTKPSVDEFDPGFLIRLWTEIERGLFSHSIIIKAFKLYLAS